MEGSDRKNIGEVGGAMGTFIIAGLETSHNGDYALAKDLISAAKDSGADAVKLQISNSRFIATKEMKQHELSFISHEGLKSHADAIGIEYVAVPFCYGAIRFFTYELGGRRLEISLNEMAQPLLLGNINHFGKLFSNLDVFIKTLMSTTNKIIEALSAMSDVKHLTLLHCLPSCMISKKEASFGSIKILSHLVGQKNIGYSDLSVGIHVPALSVLAGAKFVEKNLTLGTKIGSAEDLTAAGPKEFKQMVSKIREYEQMLGAESK